MSKAPGLAKDYDGSGQWFKIFDWGPSGSSWPLRSEFYPIAVRSECLGVIVNLPGVSDSYTSNIPKCIPSGEYLLRIQQLGIHNPGAPPQVCFCLVLLWVPAR